MNLKGLEALRFRMLWFICVNNDNAFSGCLAGTGFHQIKVNYRRRKIMSFLRLLFKTLYLHCICSYQLKLHQHCVHYTSLLIQCNLALCNST